MVSSATSSWNRFLRLVTSFVGGYLFTNAVIAFLGSALQRLGMVKSEAVLLALVVGFLVGLVMIIYIVASQRLIISTILVLASSVFMIVCAYYLV